MTWRSLISKSLFFYSHSESSDVKIDHKFNSILKNTIKESS